VTNVVDGPLLSELLLSMCVISVQVNPVFGYYSKSDQIQLLQKFNPDLPPFHGYGKVFLLCATTECHLSHCIKNQSASSNLFSLSYDAIVYQNANRHTLNAAINMLQFWTECSKI